MPYYDLRCEKCAQEFTVKATMQERSDGLLQCPSCGSGDLATVYRKVNILKYKGKDCDVCPGPGAPASSGGGCCGGACSHHHH
jgi:putative FmdB family regulatory protein